MKNLSPLAAAQYIRMSTDTQTLSPAMQRHAISEYADRMGLRVVTTYEDEAKSGVTLGRRTGMRRLLSDVCSGTCPYSVILVYDVSRWGRFQDADESAYYEYHCRLNGVDVRYVVEPFDDQPSPGAALLKALKRSMAAEFSRELARKVTDAQHRAVSQGFQIGRMPAIGIDRVAVAEDGSTRSLARLERPRKGERIRWIHGPEEERALVKRIFDEYSSTEITMARLAQKLDCEGLHARGSRFTLTIIRSLLHAEIFRGDFVWGRRLHAAAPDRRADGHPSVVRTTRVIEPIISMRVWKAVQAKRELTGHVRRTPQSMLEDLRKAFRTKPGLPQTDLTGNGCGPRGKYIETFGSMREAMRLAGRDEQAHNDAYIRRKSRSHRLSTQFRHDLGKLLTEAGITWSSRPKEQVFALPNEVRLRFRLIWRREHRLGLRWYLPKVAPAYCNHVLLVLMEENETANELLLMCTDQYRRLRSWFAEGGTVSEKRIFSSANLIDQLRVLVEKRALPTDAEGRSAAPGYGGR